MQTRAGLLASNSSTCIGLQNPSFLGTTWLTVETMTTTTPAPEALVATTEKVVLALQTLPPSWVTYLSALLTPAVALLAVAVAVAQWRIAKNKLKLDLFERRYKVYSATSMAVHAVVARRTLSDEELQAFVEDTQGAKWLFNGGVDVYINDILDRRREMIELAQKIWDARVGNADDLAALRAKRQVHQTWFNDQVKNRWLDAQFKDFLQLEH